MSDFRLHILGCGSAKPSLRHNPACQIIERRGKLFVVDCGEGAQLALCRQRLPYTRISEVFVSHLHGDHLLGLPGLLSTMSLHDKGGRVRVHMFEKGIAMMRAVMATVGRETSFEIEYCPIPPGGGVVYEDKSMTVTAFRLYHTVPCVGFRFDEKPGLRHINGPMAKFHGVPHYAMDALRAGGDFVKADGTVVPNAVLTTAPTPSASYAYCSDTAFSPAVADAVRGVDLLYHEATYDGSLAAVAAQRGHSTAAQAAGIARMAGVGRLLIGHYSSRYNDVSALVDEARSVFANTGAADEGLVVDLSHKR